MEGAGVYFKASLCGKIYKHLSFLVEEDIRPRDDFKEAEWFLTTVEVNYKFNKYLLAGSGYMSLARYKASDELRNRYYLYATGTYSAGRFTLSVRERFQSTYKVHAEHPNNLQLYYRYHIFNVDDPVNYRHAIGICYTHRF